MILRINSPTSKNSFSCPICVPTATQFWEFEKVSGGLKNSKWTSKRMLIPIRCFKCFCLYSSMKYEKNKKSSVRGRSFTKNEHDGSQRPDTCLVCPQLKPAEQGWRHSTQGFKCQHPWSHGPTPVGRPLAPHPLLSHPGPHCKQFWLRKALRGERAGGGGDSPWPCHSLHRQVPPESQLSPGVFQGPVSLLCLLPDGAAGAQGRQEHP